MPRAVLLAALGLTLVAGCGGPKGSPEGTIKSFYSTIESQDWMDLAEMVDPDSLSKSGGPQRVAAFYYSVFQDVRDIDLSIDEALVTRPDEEAAVRFKCTATFRALGQMPYDRDCSDTIALRWHDGKWYIVVPGTGGLRPKL
ncbi:nuclear transport factor 2 family protein [Hyalangium versicolor]|uniref:nuclear transport factor 2 family protein n=1 Tax=Hyalangium versicolor TaxID=2861190 RepID=UPI001CCC5FD5|nr:nuclear transport factor 2 family protein [Hyalangium versicolor]